MSPVINFPTTFQTKSLVLNNGNIVSATLSLADAALTDTTAFEFYLSNDGGTTWEAVSRNTEHTFSSSGNDLRLLIVGNPGESIKVRATDGSDNEIRILYN